MKLEDLMRISDLRPAQIETILQAATKGDIDLFCMNDQVRSVHFDYVEMNTCPHTSEEHASRIDNQHVESFEQGDLLKVPLEGVRQLYIRQTISDPEFIYELPSANHRLSRKPYGFVDIGLTSVFVEKSVFQSLTQKNTKKSKMGKTYHFIAIKLAFNDLGKDASNEEIYKWIKDKVTTDLTQPFIYLDMDGDDIDDLSITSRKACVLKSKEKPVTKQRFQDICAEIKGTL